MGHVGVVSCSCPRYPWRIEVFLLLLGFWTLGLCFFRAAARAFASGNPRSYHMLHTLWHIALPLGGFLWIEYTRGALSWPWPAEFELVGSATFGCNEAAALGRWMTTSTRA